MRNVLGLLAPPSGALLLFLAGCSFGKDLAPEEAPAVARSRPAVLVLVPGRNLRLSEMVFKWYGFQNQVRHYSFNGIWDPAPPLESAMAETLRARLGCAAVPLRVSLDPEAFVRIVSRREQEILGRSEADAMGRPLESAYPPQEFPGSEYLVEVTIGKFGIAGGSWQASTMGIVLYGRLIRLSDGAVLWRDKILAGVRIEGMEKFSDLEKDNLALLKATFQKVVEDVLRPDSSFVSRLAAP